MSNHIDLHLHTNVSDGSDSVLELYDKVRKSDVRIFSVTDHDRMEGTLLMEQLVTDSGGLHFIRGIEFSCITPVKKCHILGYDFDPADPVFLDTLDFGIRLRQDKTNKRIQFWKDEFGIVLTQEEYDWITSIKSPGKPHFGKIIVDRGLAPDLATAIKIYVNPCKVGNSRIDASAAISAILHAGGVPVWAHPLGGEGEERLTHEEFFCQLDTLIAAGIQGLECYYSRYSKEDIDFLIGEAKKRGLLISAGSDYHGDIKPNLHIGKLNADDTDIHEEELGMFIFK